MKLAKVFERDFDKIYPIIQKLSEGNTKRETWKHIFSKSWEVPDDHCGYMLLVDDRVVGFYGTIFSTRVIEGKKRRFCNLTSWVVEEKYRGRHGLRLLQKVLSMDDCILTVLSANEYAGKIYDKVGFDLLEEYLVFFFPLTILGRKKPYKFFLDIARINNVLTVDDRRILNDHLRYNCTHILITDGDDYCYIIAKREAVRYSAYLRIIYLSKPEVILSDIYKVVSSLCKLQRVVSVAIDERFLGGVSSLFTVRHKIKKGMMFKGRQIKKENIDALYSEVILLDL